jgi:3',5'-cyclic AMP phosphodiesterase CpdA
MSKQDRFLIAFLSVGVLLTVVLVARYRSLDASQGGSSEPPAPRPDDAISRTNSPNPTPSPDRVVLTWKGDPATTQAVAWRTDPSVENPVAQLALSADGPSFDSRWAKGKFDAKPVPTFPAETAELKTGAYSSLYHTVNFTGLRPKTKYVYRVGTEKDWSEWFQFETASAHPEPFGFIYFGDAQNGLKSHWSRVVRGAYSDMPRAKFILHAGDLVNTGGNDGEWGEWHSAAGWINGMVPTVATPGNHEYSGKSGLTAHWRPQFALPENGPPGLEETCYFLDYQGTRIVSLNSNEKIDEQTSWLDTILTNRPKSIRWTVLTFHHPIYSTAKGRDNKRIREAWRPIIDRHGVDLVLQGHDHTYGRSGLMREDNVLTGRAVREQRGTVYAVSVSGAKMYALGKGAWMESSGQDVQLYQLIHIDGDKLRYEARTARGDLYDHFELRKRPNEGNELVNGVVNKLDGARHYASAAAAVVIAAAVLFGVAWALRPTRSTR